MTEAGNATKIRPRIFTTVPHYLPGYKSGGPVRSLDNLIQYFGDQYSFYVLTSDRDLGDSSQYPAIDINRWNTVGKALVRYLPPHQRGMKTIASLINEIKPDVLYFNSFFSPAFTIKPLMLKLAGFCPVNSVILAPRGEFAPSALSIKKLRKSVYLVVAKALRLYDRVIWQASGSVEEPAIRRYFGPDARIIVAPDPPVPLHALTAIGPRRVTKKTGSASFLFLGRVNRMKNLSGAISMLSRVRGNASLDIYGLMEDLNYWNECRSEISKLPPGIVVAYKGTVPHEKIPDIALAHDFLLLPSLGESFGHAILESLLTGCPVIISDRTPWRDLAIKKAGWDLSLEAPERFISVLEQCIAMAQAEYGILTAGAQRLGLEYVNDNPVVWDTNRRLLETALGRQLGG